MNREEYFFEGRKCISYHSEGAKCLIIQPVNEHEVKLLDRQVSLINEYTCGVPFALTAFEIKDWNNELSPWEAPPVFGDEGFGSGAMAILELIEKRIIPDSIQRLSLAENVPVILGGYSLAGLFALWSMYRSNIFSAIGAVSPSVWFPGWTEYARTHEPQTGYVYLSLGDKEAKTRNKIMAAVAERICIQENILSNNEAVNDCVFEWSEGNHFKDTEIRIAKGLAWCMDKIC